MAETSPLPDGVREATPEDVADILRLIRALADYEREPDAVETTEDDLRRWVFGDDPAANVLVAEAGGRVVGMALWFRTFSTWKGRPGIYLEDLFVEPEARGSGLGRSLLRALARIALDRGYARVEWVVLDWNTPSIEFYEAIGARALDEWRTYRLTGRPLAELGGTGDAGRQ